MSHRALDYFVSRAPSSRCAVARVPLDRQFSSRSSIIIFILCISVGSSYILNDHCICAFMPDTFLSLDMRFTTWVLLHVSAVSRLYLRFIILPLPCRHSRQSPSRQLRHDRLAPHLTTSPTHALCLVGRLCECVWTTLVAVCRVRKVSRRRLAGLIYSGWVVPRRASCARAILLVAWPHTVVVSSGSFVRRRWSLDALGRRLTRPLRPSTLTAKSARLVLRRRQSLRACFASPRATHRVRSV